MTKEEHQARAMLLGYTEYREKGRYYVDLSSEPRRRIDAETLEPISLEEARDRNNYADKFGKPKI